MTNTLKRIRPLAGAFAAALCSVLLALACTNAAWASSGDDSLANAGNVIGSSSESDTSTITPGKVEKDLYWAGTNLSFSGVETGGDVLIAGMNLDLSNCEANGSVRMAGMNLTLTNVVAQDNFTVAGQNIELTSCEAQGGIYCAGESITFTGKANGALFAAEKVYVDGVINGDALITADIVELGPNAVIEGTLTVESDSEPVIASSAAIGNLEFENTSGQTDGTDVASGIIAGAGIAFIGAAIASKAIGLIGTILFALILAWLGRRPVENATAMTRVHAGRIFATGAVAAIAAPVLIIALFCLVVTSPIALALTFALITLTVTAVAFAAATFSRIIFPKMNRFGAAALGGLILGIIGILPVIGTLLTIVAFMYVVGYIIQSLWEARKRTTTSDQMPPVPAGHAPASVGYAAAPAGFATAPASSQVYAPADYAAPANAPTPASAPAAAPEPAAAPTPDADAPNGNE